MMMMMMSILFSVGSQYILNEMSLIELKQDDK